MDYETDLMVVKDIDIRGVQCGDYRIDHESVSFSLPYPFPCKFCFTKDFKYLFVTPAMLRLPTFLKYHNIQFLKQQLTQIRCVMNNCLLVHGAAWKRDVGYLAVGFPNSGKTTTALTAMQSRIAEFCSDENVIINADTLEMTPVDRKSFLTRAQFKLAGLPTPARLWLAELKAKLCPALFESGVYTKLPYERRSFKLEKIIYLSGGTLDLMTDYEFPFFTNPVLLTYATTGWDLAGVVAKYRNIIRRITDAL